MIRVNSTNELLDALGVFIEKDIKKKRERQQEANTVTPLDSTFKLGTVDPNYMSGRPRIIFEGEDEVSSKAYPYLSSYTPHPGDVVLLVKVSNSYIILGKRI